MTNEIILQILIGGLLGMTGQGLRVIVGLKKMNDEALKTQVQAKDLFDAGSLFISLLIGFCAGILCIISLTTFKADFFKGDNAKQVILAIIAAGYAGTDFIEGFIKKYLPSGNNGGVAATDAYKNSAPAKNIKLPETNPPKGSIPQY